jgi:hypothetical protein
MNNPYRKTFKDMQNITGSATYKKGIIAKLYLDSASADVVIVGSNQTVLKNISFSSAIDLNDIMVGDKCRVDMFSEYNPSDSVIAYTYGRKKKGVISDVNSSIEMVGIDQDILNITPIGTFFNGQTLIEIINSGNAVIDQKKLNIVPTGKFFNGKTFVGTINDGAEMINGTKISGSVDFGLSTNRFLTGYFTTMDSINYKANHISGISGSFSTSGPPKTITVTNGIITSIV